MRNQLAALAASEDDLDVSVAAMTDEHAAQPCRLAGWTRAMLVTHLARNAESNAAMIAAALNDVERPQYPGGPAQREEDIAAGKDRGAAELLDDLRKQRAYLAHVFSSVPEDAWEKIVQAGVGERPIRSRVGSRRFEVEVHHADLDLGYSYRNWPADFVETEWPHMVSTIPMRVVPDVFPPGKWRIGTWLVETYGDVVVKEAPGSDARAAVEGSDRALLAWLIGRESVESAKLFITGDDRIAELPSWFPLP